MLLDALKPYATAVVAFIAPGATVAVASVQSGSEGGGTITSAEWVTIIATMIITAGAVYTVPNKDPKALHQSKSVQPPRA